MKSIIYKSKISNYNSKDSGFVYFLALTIPIAVGIILSFCLLGSPQDESGKFVILKEVWFSCVSQILMALSLTGIWFFYSKAKNISYNAIKIKTKTNPWFIVICVVLGVSLCLLTDKFITMFAVGLQQIGLKINTSLSIPLDCFGNYVLALFVIALLPALTEELIYRGIILNGLRSFGKWPAILMSSLAFCLMHLNVGQFPFTFLLGIVLGYVMFETSCLWLCMILHFVNNATVLTGMYIAQGSGMPQITALYAVEAIVLFLVAIAVIVFAFWLIKLIKQKNKKQTIEQNEKNELMQKSEKTLEEQNPKSIKNIIMLLVGFGLAIIFTCINYL